MSSVCCSTPLLFTHFLSELWATDDYRDSKYTQERVPKPNGQIVTKAFLKRLQSTTFPANPFSSQHPLVPKLRYLKLGVQSHFDGDEVFVNAIQSRWERPDGGWCSNEMDRLRTVVLYVVGRDLVAQIYGPLKRIDREGMMISVFGNEKRVV
ncbi:hypothetical protein PQX77_005375 [Marasmius sp. AFHP31]|nr:hypothetical protein PQX77_005375 [Marasmius sp. AFHP31]